MSEIHAVTIYWHNKFCTIFGFEYEFTRTGGGCSIVHGANEWFCKFSLCFYVTWNIDRRHMISASHPVSFERQSSSNGTVSNVLITIYYGKYIL